MENSDEDLSSTANHSFSGHGGGEGAASEESGWTSYIDYFMETQRRREAAASSAADASTDDDVGRCRSTSEYSGDCEAGGSAPLPALAEPSEASRRLSLRKGMRRKKKVVYDDSLEDTATSPISSPKLIKLGDSGANHQPKKESSCDDIISDSKKGTTADELGHGTLIYNGANTTNMTKDDGAYDNNNELRKKGLCLIPMSAFHV